MRIRLCCAILMMNLSVCAAEWQQVALSAPGATGGLDSHLAVGALYKYSLEDLPGTLIAEDDTDRQVAFASELEYRYSGFQSGAEYRLRLHFLSDSERVQSVELNGRVMIGELALENGVKRVEELDIPPDLLREDRLSLKVNRIKGPNAVVSRVEILSSAPGKLSNPTQVELAELLERLQTVYSPFARDAAGEVLDHVKLDGEWSFSTAPPEGFWNMYDPEGEWSAIEVPGQWLMQGFSVKGAAGYRREFELPADWDGKRIKLRFDAVYSVCDVWLNGRHIGAHTGGFTPFELDITAAARPGRNLLALKVGSASLADALASGMKYAAHDLGGITRSVQLFALPPTHVNSLHVIAGLNDDLDRGEAVLEFGIDASASANSEKLSVEASIFEWRAAGGDYSAPLARARRVLGKSAGGVLSAERIAVPLKDPKLWHPENPNLYIARLELRLGGEAVETVERRFGFRKIEVRDGQILVNNRPVTLRGVNRHEVHPLRGRSLAPGQWRRDVELFKAGNVNLIRTSHYPPDQALMEAADELGMFVEAEGPFCWAHQARGDEDEMRDLVVGQMLELVERDRSHPSILFWSLANESSWNGYFALASQAVRMKDPQRPQTFEFFPWGAFTGLKPDHNFCEIASNHYPGPEGPERYAEYSRPMNFGEYCHLNSYNRHELVTDPSLRDSWGRGFAKMFADMREAPSVAGGSLWAAIDDSFFIPDGRTVGYGTWGPIDGWRRPKPEYWHMLKAYSPVRLKSTRIDRTDPRVEVANLMDFTPIEDLMIEYSPDGDKWRRLDTDGIEIAPGAAGIIDLPRNVFGLRFSSPQGNLIDEYRLSSGDSQPESDAVRIDQSLRVGEQTESFTVADGKLAWRLDKQSGRLTAGFDGREVLQGGPHLMILSLNDKGGTQMTGVEPEYAPHTDTCSGWKLASVSSDGKSVAIKGAYDQAAGEYRLRFGRGGRLEIAYRFELLSDINPRQTGIVLDLHKRFDTLSWERKGLWSHYPDDHIGRLTGQASAMKNMHPCGPAGPREQPDWPWSLDGNQLGSNDFRSTKENILRAALSDDSGLGMRVHSDASQHLRAWLDGERLRVLVADYNNPGSERFYKPHAALEYRALERGDIIEGVVRLSLEKEIDFGVSFSE